MQTDNEPGTMTIPQLRTWAKSADTLTPSQCDRADDKLDQRKVK
jgi:hypothetical protein